MMKSANTAHSAFHDSLKAALTEHQHLSPPEMLAIASQFVGTLLALQDQRTMTAERGLDLIGKNIEIGNAMMIEVAFGETGGSA